LSVVVLIFTGSLSAQQIAVNNEKVDPDLEKKALDLLETVASKVPSLKSPDNRIALTCAVADLLWTRDEKRARTLFENVTKEMSALVATIDYSDSQSYQLISLIIQQREQVLNRMARHDPELALNFLKATRLPADSPQVNQFTERNLEISLSRLVASRDPERALQIARESLTHGYSNEITTLIQDLQRKNSPAAQSLYGSVVDRLKGEDLTQNSDVANIACNLVNSFVPPQADEATYRDLLETVVKAALSMSTSDPTIRNQVQNVESSLRSILPMVQKYLPGRAQALAQWTARASRSVDPGNQMWNEINQAMQSGTVDDVLALAAKYPADMRSQIYQQAAWKASNSGDDARASQIANELVSNPVQRRQLLEQLENQKLWRTLNENKIDEARSLLSASKSDEQRIQILERIATMLLSKEDKKGARGCLEDMRSIVNEMPRGSQKVWHQFQLARLYAPIDPNESFTILNAVVGQINELVSAAVIMDGFENKYFKNGEWISNGGSSVGSMVTQCREVLGQLARQNFDRAEALAEQLERPEIRLLTQVDIAQSALSGDLAVVRIFSRRWRD
jgi:hypothetical protein